MTFSHVLQQSSYHPRSPRRFDSGRRLVISQHYQELPSRHPQHDYYGHDLLGAILRFHLLYFRLVCPCYFFDDIFHGGSTQQTAYCGIRFDFLRCPGHHSKRVCYIRGLRQRNRLRRCESATEFETQNWSSANISFHTHEREQSKHEGWLQIIMRTNGIRS
jgi:hypothetical protein